MNGQYFSNDLGSWIKFVFVEDFIVESVICREEFLCSTSFMKLIIVNLDLNTGLIRIPQFPLDQRLFEVLRVNLGGGKT